ncbi:MAG: M20/M25/M40 family metallo-hydrolase [Myxococcales bacterium]|nr:M20/M25/M40 family metallo-hydrolase [Myxococcales bacterium]
MRPLRRTPSRLLLAAALLFACRPSPDATETPTKTAENGAQAPAVDPWAAPAEPALATIQAHLAFLADDAQEGRPPGTEADVRVQEHVIAAMEAAGLEPAFGGSFRQPLEVIDGVRLRGGKASALTLAKGGAVDHRLVPFGHDTADAPVEARLVYVGQGIADPSTEGDYKTIGKKVDGAIAVILATSPDDPHMRPSLKRPQSRVIAARDRGAVAAILVDPELEVPYPNHGAYSDLQIPVISVGKSAAQAIFAELGARGDKLPKLGARSRGAASIATPIEPIRLATANIGGILRGDGSTGKRIVVGAHMDHLGHGTSSSLAPGVDAIHNGADDNASGVATLLALAESLATLPASARPYDVVFYAFAAEEMGLLGSKHLVDALADDEREVMAAMLNFDMVGRLRDDTVIVAGTGTSTPWKDLLERSRGALTIKASDDGYGASDQTSFYEAGVPVLHFFTGPHDDYHKPSDDLDKINLEGAAAIGAVAQRVIAGIMQDRPELDYIKVERKASSRGGFRVSLGTIPDYAAQVDGVKLTGVRPGGPAEKAGLKADDVIVALGGREIHNLDDYMAAFGSLKPDVEIDVVVMRKNERVELKMTPAQPSRR